jgi:hypothetical protein
MPQRREALEMLDAATGVALHPTNGIALDPAQLINGHGTKRAVGPVPRTLSVSHGPSLRIDTVTIYR